MAWHDFFTGGVTSAIEGIAKEWIDTDLESAEAKTLMVKALDPNGKLRRDVTRFTCMAYGFYLVAMIVMGFMHIFSLTQLMFHECAGLSQMHR